MKLTRVSAAVMMSAIAVMANDWPGEARGRTTNSWGESTRIRSVKRYPRMVTSSNADIAEHNRNVVTRQVLRRSNLRDFKLRQAGRRATGQL